MQQDHLGNPVSAMTAAALRGIDDFIGGFLAYESRAERILAVAAAAPDCCLANVYAGYLWMLLEAPEAASKAATSLEFAERGAPGATAREAMNAALLGAWVRDDMPAALQLCAAIVANHPCDLVVAKIHQYFDFNRGNAPGMLRTALAVLPHTLTVPYAHGMAAFGYEQCHLLDEAESAARRALELTRHEPWAQHALAHVLLTRGRIDAGAAFLESMQDTWTGLNSFMITHLWWHLALFYLSQGRDARVLEVYDRHCWGVVKSYSQDQIGAVSLLARVELAGIDVGDRWQDLADHLAARTHDVVQPFLTLHYLYGLARARRSEAQTLLGTVRNVARAPAAPAREVWRDVALPACEALHAHAHGDVRTAWELLSVALPRMPETGGSHAQRDLFEQILLDSAIRHGRLTQAQQLLEARRGSDPDGVPVNLALAGVYDQLGLPALAERARVRALSTRARHRSDA